MTDKEKATFLANLLARQDLKFNGAKEAFLFTQAYQWLLDQATPQEPKNANKRRPTRK